jgi:hypothetical protein
MVKIYDDIADICEQLKHHVQYSPWAASAIFERVLLSWRGFNPSNMTTP